MVRWAGAAGWWFSPRASGNTAVAMLKPKQVVRELRVLIKARQRLRRSQRQRRQQRQGKMYSGTQRWMPLRLRKSRGKRERSRRWVGGKAARVRQERGKGRSKGGEGYRGCVGRVMLING